MIITSFNDFGSVTFNGSLPIFGTGKFHLDFSKKSLVTLQVIISKEKINVKLNFDNFARMFRFQILISTFISIICAFIPLAQGTTPHAREFILPVRQPTFHPMLQRMINAGDLTSRVHAWVLFTDKGVFTESAFQRVREDYALRVNSQTRFRRHQRAKHDVVHFTDLPVHPCYIAAVLRIGGEQRCVSRWLNGISITVTLEELRKIQHLPFVRAIDAVLKYTIRREISRWSSSSYAPKRISEAKLDYGASWAQIHQIRVDELHARGYHGEGILIGLLDTGFDLSHKAMAQIDVRARWDFINNDGNTADEPEQDDPGQENHGSAVLSVLAGKSPGRLIGPAYAASYLLGKTEKVTEKGRLFEQKIEEDWWVAGLEWMEAQGVDVVNCSVGYANWYRFADLDGKTAKVTIAADLAADKGIVMVVSAGNTGRQLLGDIGLPGRINVPADGFKVLAVGAVDNAGRAADFSSHGPTFDGRVKPDVAAMGVGVISIEPDIPDAFDFNASGTSTSAALVSGAVALLLQAFPEATPENIANALKSTASRTENPDNTVGWGIIDAAAAYDVLLARFGVAQKPIIAVEPYARAFRSWGIVKQRAVTSILEQNYPNPFNSGTWIPFRLAYSGTITIQIYNQQGVIVRILQLGRLSAGDYLDKRAAVYWNGLSQQGEFLPSGVYFYTIKTGKFTATRRMLMVR
ncbi:MAG: S8 family peptidase [Deltaproteobacteria bacterium]|nr:S8 family peptidase [Deltaproteobacteria bacterium]